VAWMVGRLGNDTLERILEGSRLGLTLVLPCLLSAGTDNPRTYVWVTSVPAINGYRYTVLLGVSVLVSAYLMQRCLVFNAEGC
jgi:hypothetical protein